MNRKTINRQSIQGKPETLSEKYGADYLGFIQTVDTEILSKAVKGEIDFNRLAREEMANRGLDLDGKWVGFEKSKKLLSVE